MYQAVRGDGHGSARPWPPCSLEQAKADMRSLKRRGFTVWIEDSFGRFVPVEGAKGKRVEAVAKAAAEYMASRRP